jgi:hypothetical protein
MRLFCKTNSEQYEPLLANKEEDKSTENKRMGSEKWHKLLRAVGPHLAGQGSSPGFLSKAESFTVKTLTKETLGEVSLVNWRGLHPDSKQNCYTTTYLIKPWALTSDPCDAESRQDPFCAWCLCWCPCWTALFPLNLTASLLGCLGGLGRDIYNFSKSGLTQPLTANKGILLGLMPKKTNQDSARQVISVTPI